MSLFEYLTLFLLAYCAYCLTICASYLTILWLNNPQHQSAPRNDPDRRLQRWMLLSLWMAMVAIPIVAVLDLGLHII